MESSSQSGYVLGPSGLSLHDLELLFDTDVLLCHHADGLLFHLHIGEESSLLLRLPMFGVGVLGVFHLGQL